MRSLLASDSEHSLWSWSSKYLCPRFETWQSKRGTELLPPPQNKSKLALNSDEGNFKLNEWTQRFYILKMLNILLVTYHTQFVTWFEKVTMLSRPEEKCSEPSDRSVTGMTQTDGYPNPIICGNNKIFALLNNCCRILLLLHWLQIWVGTFAAYSWYARSTACHVRSVWFLRLTSLRRFYRGYRCTYPRSLRGQRRISLFMATGSSRMRECAYLSIVIIIIHYKLIN